MDVGAIATIGTVLSTFVALLVYVRSEVREVRDDVRRLDDRVYALATGLKPLIDEAQRTEKA